MGAWCAVFSPRLSEWLEALLDRREPTLCLYSHAALAWTALLMYLSLLRARRQIRFRLNTPLVVARLGALCGQTGLLRVPHGDTVADYLSGVEPDRMQQVPQAMARALLEARRLERFRLLGVYYLVTVDMSGHLYLGDSPSAFTEGCLRQTGEDGRTIYYRPVCEAKLVTGSGLALSVGSEFVENPPGEPAPQDPQDSELPAVWEEFQSLLPLAPENRLTVPADRVLYEYAWINSIAWGERTMNVLQCRWVDLEGKPHRFVWLTDIPLEAGNVHTLAQDGGRKRWKIENEGFRAQKHGGLQMEHAYAKDPTAAKNFYLLLQAAHTLSQMLEVYLDGKAAVKRSFGSLLNLGLALLESLRRDPLPAPPQLAAFLARSIQIRFRPTRASPGSDTS